MSARRVLLALILAALGAPLAGGCGSSGPATYVWVDVVAAPAVRGVTKLEVTVSQGGERLTKTFGDGAAPFTLPTSFTVTPNSHLGSLTIEGVTLDAEGVRTATGTVVVSIAKGGQPHAELALRPLDFQVNTTVAGSQIVTDYGSQSGRQLAAAADGSLVAVFENIGSLGRYDGLGRLFDGDGAPRQNEVSHTKDDFVVNQGGTESVYYITVTAAPAGGFLAGWADFNVDPACINARAFDATGAPSAEVAVSPTTATAVGAVHAAAFADGSYVIVWSQARSAAEPAHEIRARLLDAAGQPRRNANTGNDLDFGVGAYTTHEMVLPAVAIYAADQSFMVAWLDQDPSAGGTIHAQRFSVEGGVRGSELTAVATSTMTFPEGPNLAATPDGYLVVYTDEATSSTDTDVLVRFISKDGLLPQPAYRVNTSTDGAQLQAALAVAADGSTLVVWSDEQARDDDNDSGSIRARALHWFGLPIGTDFIVNTTTPKWQHYPSVAAAAHGGFMVTWQDESAVGPDVDQSGIRGRMIYPDYAAGGGGVGAACGSGDPCGAELQCTPRGTGSFCHLGCSESSVGQPCPTYGGVCTAAATAGTPAPVCLFR